MFSAQEIFVLRRENGFLKTHNTKLVAAYTNQKNKADRLEKENKRLRDENSKLKEELEKIKKQRDTYKGMIFKANVKQEDKTAKGKKLGGQIGHIGTSRRLPARVDRIRRVFVENCPNCQQSLARSLTTIDHTVEDIPEHEEIRTLVVKWQLERQWCKSCRKEVVAKPAGVIPNSRLGINLIVQMLIFKYSCRMSLEVMVDTLCQTYGLVISAGGIVQIFHRAKRYLGKKRYRQLLQRLRASPVKHADETSWRIKGTNGWLWGFFTKDTAYYTIEETRGKGVAQRILAGSAKDHVLVRDDYAAYKKIDTNQQSCWAHLLTKSREAAHLKTASSEVKKLHKQLKGMFAQLKKITQQDLREEERRYNYNLYLQYLGILVNTVYRAKDARDIQTRIKNQKANLLTAILFPNVPLTNNLAERQLRPAVVIRKISGGSRSINGAETLAVNMSIIQTLKMRNQPLVLSLKDLILQSAIGEN